MLNVSTTVVQFSWMPLDCHNYSGLFVGYEYKLWKNSSGSENVLTDIVNVTQKNFTHLIPFTNYSFSVRFRNSQYYGANSFVDFMTLEDGNNCLLFYEFKLLYSVI